VCESSMSLAPQSDGDLGARMLAAVRDLIDTRGYDAAVLVGSDMPWLTAQHLRDAADMLQGSDLVVGPSDDGGYYLIGMTRVRPSLFENIAWGTSEVMVQTRRAAEQIGLETRLIQRGYDVDTIEDLRRLEGDLARASSEGCSCLREWFSEA
jgi:rSAM/selenodomain-associated transferase 1